MKSHPVPGNPDRTALFLRVLAALAFLFFAWPTLVVLADVYSSEEDYSHGFMVPLVSGFAMYEILRESDISRCTGHWIGYPFIILGVLLNILGNWYNVAMLPDGLGVGFLAGGGLILCLAGMCLVLGGLGGIRIFAFPLAYLVFALPFPQSLTLPLTLWLRNHVSVLSEGIIRDIGITIFREGNVLHLANASLGVEDACSGIRSFWILMAGAAAVGYVMRIGWVRSCLMCLLTLPISIVMNVVRVVGTAWLVVNVDVVYAAGRRHEFAGWLTFAGGLAVLVICALVLSRTRRATAALQEPEHVAAHSASAAFSSGMRTRFCIALILFFAAGAATGFVIEQHYLHYQKESPSDRKRLVDLPDALGKYHAVRDVKLLQAHLDILEPSDYLVRYYADSGLRSIVELRIIYWDSADLRSAYIAGAKAHTPDDCFPMWGFKTLEEYELAEPLAGLPSGTVSIRLFEKDGNKQMVLFWDKQKILRNRPDRIRGKLQTLLDSWSNPFVNRSFQYVVTIISAVDTSRDESTRRALSFARDVTPLLPEYGIE